MNTPWAPEDRVALTLKGVASLKMPSGIVIEISGAPGTGKVLIARAVAEWLRANVASSIYLHIDAGDADRVIARVRQDTNPDIIILTTNSRPETDGTALISAERHRGIEEEGFDAEHDDAHKHGELVDAALSYIRAAINVGHPAMKRPPKEWPWERGWWKPSHDRIRNLVKAGALIASEIDRLLRSRKGDVRIPEDAGIPYATDDPRSGETS